MSRCIHVLDRPHPETLLEEPEEQKLKTVITPERVIPAPNIAQIGIFREDAEIEVRVVKDNHF